MKDSIPNILHSFGDLCKANFFLTSRNFANFLTAFKISTRSFAEFCKCS